MPRKRTTKNGRPAYKYGDQGKAYPYTPGNAASRERAKRLADRQGSAQQANRNRRGR